MVKGGRGALFSSAREVAYVAVMTALLIAAQYALAAVAGIELVTALFLPFCTVFGVRRGCMVATCFSLLRCLLWGFAVNVIALYLIYYNLFALVFGLLGRALRTLSPPRRLVCTAVAAAFMTACFTLVDDLVSPLILGMRFAPYFYASLAVLAVQPAFAAASCAVLYLPLERALRTLRKV